MNDEKCRKILQAVSIFLPLAWLVIVIVTILIPVLDFLFKYGYLSSGTDVVILFLTSPFVFFLAVFLISKYAKNIKAYTALSILVIVLELVYAMSVISLITGISCC